MPESFDSFVKIRCTWQSLTKGNRDKIDQISAKKTKHLRSAYNPTNTSHGTGVHKESSLRDTMPSTSCVRQLCVVSRSDFTALLAQTSTADPHWRLRTPPTPLGISRRAASARRLPPRDARRDVRPLRRVSRFRKPWMSIGPSVQKLKHRFPDRTRTGGGLRTRTFAAPERITEPKARGGAKSPGSGRPRLGLSDYVWIPPKQRKLL